MDRSGRNCTILVADAQKDAPEKTRAYWTNNSISVSDAHSQAYGAGLASDIEFSFVIATSVSGWPQRKLSRTQV